jgi:hypothetical protein
MIRDEFGTVGAYTTDQYIRLVGVRQRADEFSLYSREVMKVIQNCNCIIPSVVRPRPLA